MKRPALLIACLVLTATALPFGASTAAPPLTFGFVTVPAAEVTSASRVELRLAITNHDVVPRPVEIAFSVDADGGSVALPGTPSMTTIAPGAQILATSWWKPGSLTGDRILRWRVTGSGVTHGTGTWHMHVIDDDIAAPPRFSGGWIEPGNVMFDPEIGPAEVEARIDEMHELGMSTIVVAYVEYEWSNSWGPFYPSRIPELGEQEVSFDVIGTILRRASALGMSVYLGLGRGPNGPLVFDEPFDSTHAEMEAAAAFGERVAEELHTLYGNEPSFYGWYISHEANDYSNARYFYDDMARRLDRFGMHKPVMVAPAGTPTGISREYLDAAEVDVYAYQDAVGAGYVGPGSSCQGEPEILGQRITVLCRPYTYSYKPYNRIGDLDEIFEMYASWHEGSTAHIWSDTEIWQMDGPLYGDAYAAPCTRVRDQIEPVQRHVSQITAYDFFGYMRSPANTTTMPRRGAAELYSGYADFVRGDTPALCAE